jgi:hypothetical protein
MTVNVGSVENTVSRRVGVLPRNTIRKRIQPLVHHWQCPRSRLIWSHFHQSLSLLTTLSHPNSLLPFLPPHWYLWNSITRCQCYLISLMRDPIRVLHPISTQSSLKHWPNNTSSESNSGNSTRRLKQMQRRPRNVWPFMLGLKMTPLLSFTSSNLDSFGPTSSSRQPYFQL